MQTGKPGLIRALPALLALLLAGSLTGSASLAADTKPPRVFCLSPEALTETRARAAKGDPELRPALDRLVRDADQALTAKPPSVMDKPGVPPSGDKHDYMSLAPYFWPDPAKKDGLPYIRRDGERNPEAGGSNSDSPRWGKTTSAVETLSLAYYFTGKEEYAAQAARLLRAWYLDPATRMNPNLNFAQAVRGVNDGRGTGIIESVQVTRVVDSLGLLGGSPSWSAADQAGMEAWMKAYLDWLLTSKNGKDEQRAANNHGMYYDVQVVSLALFTGQKEVARRVLEAAREKRIAAQVEPDGSQPRELARTKSFSYSVFNLTAMLKLAALGERAGVDLWGYQSSDGRSIRRALEFLAPYVDPGKPWPRKQIASPDRAALLPLLQQAYLHTRDERYRQWVKVGSTKESASSRMWLLYPPPG
jgi:hypothetical protein